MNNIKKKKAVKRNPDKKMSKNMKEPTMKEKTKPNKKNNLPDNTHQEREVVTEVEEVEAEVITREEKDKKEKRDKKERT